MHPRAQVGKELAIGSQACWAQTSVAAVMAIMILDVTIFIFDYDQCFLN
jgi:hypothetical protein